jgi:hypothetical protein
MKMINNFKKKKKTQMIFFNVEKKNWNWNWNLKTSLKNFCTTSTNIMEPKPQAPLLVKSFPKTPRRSQPEAS